MDIWPEDKKQLKKTLFALLFSFILACVLITVLFVRYRQVAKAPPCTTVASMPLEAGPSVCPQRVDNSGWEIIGGRLRTYPRCLTVMNSRFGSRFNLDWYFGIQETYSSILGTLEDKQNYLQLTVEDENGINQLFPLLANDSFPIRSVDMGLTSQKINFKNDQMIISLEIISPFAPSRSVDDENTIISSAPFFYLTLEANNKSNRPQAKTVTLTFNGAFETDSADLFKAVYLTDGVRSDGRRVLAVGKNQPDLDLILDGSRGGVSWQAILEPKETKNAQLIYAGYLDGPALNDASQTEVRALKFAYTNWFSDVDEVINFALENKRKIETKRLEFENTLDQKKLSPQEKWLLAQSFHSYLGNSWWVTDEDDSSGNEYYVWEGTFKYLNTLDVAHDYGILEGLYFPWVLKLELESWAKSAKQDEYGWVIPHDLGSRFNYRGYQAYGIEGSETSGMPVEENANFVLLAYWYWHQTSDDQFIQDLSPLIKRLVESLIARDGNNNGLADMAVRMTTYDNDGNSALKEAPDNTYLGLKQLAAYLAAQKMNDLTSDQEFSQLLEKQLNLITNSYLDIYKQKGFIPLSLDPDFTEKNLFDNQEVKGIDEQGFAFITGLFYPALTDLDSPYLEKLKPVLASVYPVTYEKSLVTNEIGESYGLRLAEKQALSLGWFSHSAMADYVAQKFFNQDYNSTRFWFPLLYDSPYAFADGQYFKTPLEPNTTLGFYPRGAAFFARLR